MTTPSPYPLAGITVVDLSQIYNGPYATFLMAQAGADVIKVEPKGGEHLRRRGVVGGASLPFAMLNANKRSVSLDLKNPQGRDLLIEMVKRADVLVENFAPGVTERLGLGVEAMHKINPRLVYAQSSGYGQEGLYRDYPAMDLTVQAMSGVMGITGFPEREPVKAGPALCDFFAGVHLYGGIVTALLDRERTGRGRTVEVAMLDAVYASLASTLGMCFGQGWKDAGRTGNRHGGLAESPYNVYPTSDGYIAIICVGEQHWKNLLDAMGRKDLHDDPRFQTSEDARRAHGRGRRPGEHVHQTIQQAGSVRAADEASRAVRAGAHLDGGRERPASASARHAAMDRSSRVRPHRRAVEPDALRRRAAAGA